MADVLQRHEPLAQTGEVTVNDQYRTDRYIADVIAVLPHGMPGVEQIVAELRANIDERLAAGTALPDVLAQLGPPDVLAESYTSALPLEAAPLGRRLAAKLVDVGLYVGIIPVGLYIAYHISVEAFFYAIFGLVGVVAAYGMYLIVAERLWGQTLGKRLFGLRVVRESGARITWIQAIVRQLPTIFHFWPIDAVFVLFNDKRQRAFELVSKTRVVLAQDAMSPASPASASGIAYVLAAMVLSIR
jgi:uncharacterized RDD family membrane protein YckC